MSNFIASSRDQVFLLPPDLKAWIPDDDLAHFIMAAVERIPIRAFRTGSQPGGKAQYHPQLMLMLLVYSYAHGIFSSRRIERATYREIVVRFVAANLHPDHDTIAVFRQANKAAFEAAFLQILLLARETGLLRLGTVSIDGTEIDANASKTRSVRDDRACELRTKLAADIAHLTAQAEAARPAYETKKAAYDARKGRRGSKPKPPDDTPPPERQSNLTDPDSALMRRSDAHEYRQAHNAQAVVPRKSPRRFRCAEGSSFAATVPGLRDTMGLPQTVLADTGHASSPAVKALQASNVEPLVAIGRTQPHRPYDVRPPSEPKALRRITKPWRIAMKAKMETDDAKALYKKRKQSVETVFGIIKGATGFRRFHRRGVQNAATGWTLIALAYNCRRIHRPQPA